MSSQFLLQITPPQRGFTRCRGAQPHGPPIFHCPSISWRVRLPKDQSTAFQKDTRTGNWQAAPGQRGRLLTASMRLCNDLLPADSAVVVLEKVYCLSWLLWLLQFACELRPAWLFWVTLTLVAAAAANFLTRHEEEEEVVEDDDDDSAAECDIWERYCGWLSTATVVIWSQMIMIKININSKWARVVLFFDWSVCVVGGGCLVDERWM